MPPNNQLSKCFSIALQKALLKRYKKIPSSSFIAKEFNLRSAFTKPITAEAARRWIKGISVPEFEKLAILRNWLALDLNLICIESTMPPTRKEQPQSLQVSTIDHGKFQELVHQINCDVDLLLKEIKNLQKI
jgi:hypothetical protein